MQALPSTSFCPAQSGLRHCAEWPSASSEWSFPIYSGCSSLPVTTSPSALCPGSKNKVKNSLMNPSEVQSSISAMMQLIQTQNSANKRRMSSKVAIYEKPRDGVLTLARVSGDTSSSGTHSLVVFLPGICPQHKQNRYSHVQPHRQPMKFKLFSDVRAVLFGRMSNQ